MDGATTANAGASRDGGGGGGGATRRTLQALAHYTPSSISDGPASLLRVAPVDVSDLRAALASGGAALPQYSLHALANLAAALAATEQRNAQFQDALAAAAIVQLDLLVDNLLLHQRSRPAADAAAGWGALAAAGTSPWADVCHLTMASARLRVTEQRLWERLAAAGEPRSLGKPAGGLGGQGRQPQQPVLRVTDERAGGRAGGGT